MVGQFSLDCAEEDTKRSEVGRKRQLASLYLIFCGRHSFIKWCEGERRGWYMCVMDAVGHTTFGNGGVVARSVPASTDIRYVLFRCHDIMVLRAKRARVCGALSSVVRVFSWPLQNFALIASHGSSSLHTKVHSPDITIPLG